jgi:transposase InsO family protein
MPKYWLWSKKIGIPVAVKQPGYHGSKVEMDGRYHLSLDRFWLYLAVVIDLYLRMVVGWVLAERMTADLC